MQLSTRGAVVSKYGSISAFARHLNWSTRKANYIVNGRQQPTAEDMERMADALDIKTAEEFVRFFYPSKSTMWTND